MWKNVSWMDLIGMIGGALGAAALCVGATAVLMYPVAAQLLAGQ